MAFNAGGKGVFQQLMNDTRKENIQHRHAFPGKRSFACGL